MFGRVELAPFEACKLPQEAASAWSAVEGIVGAGYVPLRYLGKQVAKGTDYFFVAGQTLMTNPPLRRVVYIMINQLDGEYDLANVEELLG